MLLLLHLMGRFQWHELLLGLGLLPGILIGYALASRVAPHADPGYSRYAVLVVSTLSALTLIVKVYANNRADGLPLRIEQRYPAGQTMNRSLNRSALAMSQEL